MGNFLEFAFEAVDTRTAVLTVEVDVGCGDCGIDQFVVDG